MSLNDYVRDCFGYAVAFGIGATLVFGYGAYKWLKYEMKNDYEIRCVDDLLLKECNILINKNDDGVVYKIVPNEKGEIADVQRIKIKVTD